MSTCPSCDGRIEADAAFCGACGFRLRARRTTLTGAVLAGEYQIDAKLAEGGFGSIYKATHVDSGLDVALKVLHADLAADPSLAARFRREGATLARLHDPHTVATYDVGEAPDGTLYIAMELLHGESLHDRIAARGRLPWRTALTYVRELSSALAEAHDLGIIHRDLKPANIHLTTGDYVKLLDFGIAKVSGSEIDDGAQLTRMGQTIGTLEYMAPEQIIGAGCDARADIYQLGILMYEMIAGRRPFAEATEPTALITALLTQTAVAPSVALGAPLPKALDAMILRCLEREPESRFASVRDLVTALVAVLAAPDKSGPLIQGRNPTPPTATATVAQLGDDRTWVGSVMAVVPSAPKPPRVTAIGVVPEVMPPKPLAVFEVPVRGSVSDAMPLEDAPTELAGAIIDPAIDIDMFAEGSGDVAPVGPPVVEQLPRARSSHDEPVHEVLVSRDATVPPAVSERGLSFGARVVMWTFGLAAAGAAIGAGIALAAS